MSHRVLEGLPEIIYHGTTIMHYKSIRAGINLQECADLTDFSKGFYTTSNVEQAKSFAIQKGRVSGFQPLVLVYKLDTYRLEIRNGIVFPAPDKYWAEFIFNNRVRNKYMVSNFHNKDVRYEYAYGHLGDGRLANLIRKLIDLIRKNAYNKDYSIEQFSKDIQPKYPLKDDQISLHTYEAIQCLELIEEVRLDVDETRISKN